jgi:hypothetical protein
MNKILTVKELIEELQKWPGHMRISTEYSNSFGDYLSDHLVVQKEQADYNNHYEFKNSKNEKSSDFVDVLVIS